MALTLWTLPQYVALCVAYDASFTAAAIEETFIHAGCTPDGHLTEQGLVEWLWQLTGAEDDLMLCGIAEELLELTVTAPQHTPSVPVNAFPPRPSPQAQGSTGGNAFSTQRQGMIQDLFRACDPKHRGVIQGSVICRLLGALLDDANEVPTARYLYSTSHSHARTYMRRTSSAFHVRPPR